MSTSGTAGTIYPLSSTGTNPYDYNPTPFPSDGITSANVWYPAVLPEEVEDLKDFVIWCCGFTDDMDPPSKEQWDRFRNRVEEAAAKVHSLRRK